MRRAAIANGAVLIGVATLVALGVGMRLARVEAWPEIDGDEAWYGVQAGHFLRGEPYTFWTPHHNPVNPFHTGIVGLLLLAAKPQLWMLRVPCLLAGLAAIPATFRLMSRAFDQTVGTIAAVLMAGLPVSIVWSRTGYDGSQLLLFSVLALAAATAPHRGALVLLGGLAFLAHPTAIFLAPTLAAVYLARAGVFDRALSRRVRFQRLAAIGGAVALVIAFGLLMLQRPGVKHLMDVYQLGFAHHHDWAEFWGWYGRLFLVIGRVPRPAWDRAFWAIVLPVLALGSWRLVLQRRWDRLALVLGVIASAAGMALVGGTTILQPGMTRYGLALVAPSAVAFACLLREGFEMVPHRARLIPVAASLAIAALLPLGLRMDELDLLHVRDARLAERGSSRAASSNAPRRALRRIIAEVRATPDGPAPRFLVTEDWNTYMTLSYLALGRPAIQVAYLGEIGSLPDFPARFRHMLETEGYGLGAPGGAIESVSVGTFGLQALDRWTVPRAGEPALQVLRLRPEDAVAARQRRAPLR